VRFFEPVPCSHLVPQYRFPSGPASLIRMSGLGRPHSAPSADIHVVYFPYVRSEPVLGVSQLIDLIGVPKGIRTPVTAVKGHFTGHVIVRRCPAMSSKILELLDRTSTAVYYRPRPSPGHFRDTISRRSDGTKSSIIDVGDARGAAEAACVEEARLRGQDRPRPDPRLSPQ